MFNCFNWQPCAGKREKFGEHGVENRWLGRETAYGRAEFND